MRKVSLTLQIGDISQGHGRIKAREFCRVSVLSLGQFGLAAAFVGRRHEQQQLRRRWLIVERLAQICNGAIPLTSPDPDHGPQFESAGVAGVLAQNVGDDLLRR